MASDAWKSRGKVALKLGLTIVVLAFVGRHVARTWRDIQERGLSVRIDLAWLVVAVGLYVAGLVVLGGYFWRVMAAGSTPIGPYPAIRAYVISHLAKYVPGKAMVVVVRVALVTPFGAKAAPATFATLYETLVMMGCGGLLAALGFASGSGSGTTVGFGRWSGVEVDVPLAGLGLALGLAFLVVTWPRVFAGLARRPIARLGPDALPRFSVKLLAEGLAWTTVAWALFGLSQVAVIRGVAPGGLAPSLWPLAMASVALATVAGFAVPISPGGLGVREWVLWTALASALDRDLAVVAALGLRLVWVVGEAVAAAVLIGVRPRRSAAG